MSNNKLKNVLVTTQHRGVWFAQVDAKADLTAKTLQNLKNCKMAIYWGTKHGIHELCDTGPTSSSRISATTDILVLHDITGIFSVTEKAAEVWLRS